MSKLNDLLAKAKATVLNMSPESKWEMIRKQAASYAKTDTRVRHEEHGDNDTRLLMSKLEAVDDSVTLYAIVHSPPKDYVELKIYYPINSTNGIPPLREPIQFEYVNYKGEKDTRTVVPVGLGYGCNEWHPEEQWLLIAYDLKKMAYRSFALKDCNFAFLRV